MEKFPVGSETEMETEGFTLAGISQLMAFVFEPMLALPLYVVIVSVMETEVPVVFSEDRETGGVHDILLLLDFVQTVPEELPQAYVIVCVKLSS